MLSLLLALALPSVQAAEPTPAPKPPAPARVSIAPAGRVDLGSLGPREVKRISYTFTNTSGAPIRFRILDLSPGVTAQGPALQEAIPAQGKASLEVQVDPTDWVGHQKRSIRLGTDDPGQGQYLLPMAYFARPDLTVDAEKKGWGTVAPHESPALVFHFKRETPEPIQLKLESALPPHLEAEIEPGKGQTELRIVLRPQRLEPGVRVGLEMLQVSTNAPHQPKFTLYADWRVQWPVEAIPQRLVFLDPNEDRKTLRLQSTQGKPFRVTGAHLEGQGFRLVERGPDSLTLQRVGREPAKALLWIEFEGQDLALKVPLSYLPPSARE